MKGCCGGCARYWRTYEIEWMEVNVLMTVALIVLWLGDVSG